MTPYEINERIALALKWKMDPDGPDLWIDPDGEWDKIGIPDWAGDKNLTFKEKQKFQNNEERDWLPLFETALTWIMSRDLGWDHEKPFVHPEMHHMATAKQEAEALIMVMEAWQ